MIVLFHIICSIFSEFSSWKKQKNKIRAQNDSLFFAHHRSIAENKSFCFSHFTLRITSGFFVVEKRLAASSSNVIFCEINDGSNFSPQNAQKNNSIAIFTCPFKGLGKKILTSGFSEKEVTQRLRFTKFQSQSLTIIQSLRQSLKSKCIEVQPRD